MDSRRILAMLYKKLNEAHQLSFCSVNFISHNIIEVIVNQGIEVSIEMVEEYDAFMANNFDSDFAILINRINHYDYSPEAKWLIGSNPYIKAMAVIYYDDLTRMSTDLLKKTRAVDGWNLQSFSGLELGWQRAVNWLAEALTPFKK